MERSSRTSSAWTGAHNSPYATDASVAASGRPPSASGGNSASLNSIAAGLRSMRQLPSASLAPRSSLPSHAHVSSSHGPAVPPSAAGSWRSSQGAEASSRVMTQNVWPAERPPSHASGASPYAGSSQAGNSWHAAMTAGTSRPGHAAEPSADLGSWRSRLAEGDLASALPASVLQSRPPSSRPAAADPYAGFQQAGPAWPASFTSGNTPFGAPATPSAALDRRSSVDNSGDLASALPASVLQSRPPSSRPAAADPYAGFQQAGPAWPASFTSGNTPFGAPATPSVALDRRSSVDNSGDLASALPASVLQSRPPSSRPAAADPSAGFHQAGPAWPASFTSGNTPFGAPATPSAALDRRSSVDNSGDLASALPASVLQSRPPSSRPAAADPYAGFQQAGPAWPASFTSGNTPFGAPATPSVALDRRSSVDNSGDLASALPASVLQSRPPSSRPAAADPSAGFAHSGNPWPASLASGSGRSHPDQRPTGTEARAASSSGANLSGGAASAGTRSNRPSVHELGIAKRISQADFDAIADAVESGMSARAAVRNADTGIPHSTVRRWLLSWRGTPHKLLMELAE